MSVEDEAGSAKPRRSRFVVEVYARVRESWTVTAVSLPTASEATIAARHLAERGGGTLVVEFITNTAGRHGRRVLARFGDLPPDVESR